ncbi:copal-8-ol diphosphate hydratase, chloroplastic-like [Lycium ferocissimum]|uniref:copal-8-ol diphosphate hydratase, chloroplastic-like n=1 Tax=Lycium ferocissimum TaxID=112874 RepID=UPI00281522D1|nr:copal-8-ol diphosphate hydratase, chloroplastic-like [Lycium ferocissimum]
MSIEEEKTARQEEAELLVRTINLWGGHLVDDEIIANVDYKNIPNITNKVCYELQSGKVSGINGNWNHNGSSHPNEVESDMEELVKLVLDNSSCGINKDMKKTFLAVAKTFYYTQRGTHVLVFLILLPIKLSGTSSKFKRSSFSGGGLSAGDGTDEGENDMGLAYSVNMVGGLRP